MITTTLSTVLDADTFADLWRTQREDIRAYLSRRCPTSADELTSETFCRAWAGRATFRPEAGSPRGWLFTIARNTLADHLRGEQRRPVSYLDTADIDHYAPPAASDPVAVEAVNRVTVVALLAALPERYRLVLVTRFLADLDVTDVAETLGWTGPAVKAATFRATHELRERVGGAA